MKHIPAAVWYFISFFILLALITGLIQAGTARTNATEYKSSIIKQIENSNFNDSVIDSCIAQAEENGYTLTIEKIVTDEVENKQIAEIVLSYTISIPVVDIEQTIETRGIAR